MCPTKGFVPHSIEDPSDQETFFSQESLRESMNSCWMKVFLFPFCKHQSICFSYVISRDQLHDPIAILLVYQGALPSDALGENVLKGWHMTAAELNNSWKEKG